MRRLVGVVCAALVVSCAALTGLDNLGVEGSPSASPSPSASGSGSSRPSPSSTSTSPFPFFDGSFELPDAMFPDVFVPDDPGRPAPKVEQTKNNFGETATLATPINATKSGTLIVVAIGKEDQSVTSITDNAPGGGNAYLPAGFNASHDGCGVSGEIYVARNARPGATLITATGSRAAYFQMWVLELANVSMVDVGAATNNGMKQATVPAPAVTPTVARSVVVSLGVPCEAVTALETNSAFTGLPIQQGNGTAYLITERRGSFGATWTSNSSTWCATTVAFK